MHLFSFLVESLIGILEAIGSHSVTSSELKKMISLFSPLENGQQVNKYTVSLNCREVEACVFLLSDGLDFLPMNINSGHLLFLEKIKTTTDRTSAKFDFDHIQNIMSFTRILNRNGRKFTHVPSRQSFPNVTREF